MKKKCMMALSALALLLCLLPAALAADGTVGVQLDGVAIAYPENMGTPFVDDAGRTQVPFRQTLETFGAVVTWDAQTRTAMAQKDGVAVEVPIGQKYIVKNGVQVPNDTVAALRGGRTYLPIRAVLEAFGAAVGWDGESHTVLVTTGSGNLLRVYFLDVGQADSILIDNGSYEVLIDGGNNQDGATVVQAIRPYVDGDLDLMIATHPDADHIGGLDTVLASYDVSMVIDSGDTSKTTKTYQDYMEAVKNEPHCVFMTDEDRTLDLGRGATLQIIETGDGYRDTNDNSVVSLLRYGTTAVLLTGDMEAQAESASLGKFGDVDVLKAGHHGSRTSSSAAFLAETRPEYIIVSAGKDNRYGHPHAEALQRFLAAGAVSYGTFRSGTIVLTTDGSTYSFNTTRALTLADAGAAA